MSGVAANRGRGVTGFPIDGAEKLFDRQHFAAPGAMS
jgi:hypothetical protein